MSGRSRCESFGNGELLGDASTHMCICMQVYMRMSLYVDILRSKHIHRYICNDKAFPSCPGNEGSYREAPRMQSLEMFLTFFRLTVEYALANARGVHIVVSMNMVAPMQTPICYHPCSREP